MAIGRWLCVILAAVACATAACGSAPPRGVAPASTEEPSAGASNAALPFRPEQEASYVVAAAGGTPRNIFSSDDYDYFDAAPSPDGSTLAVAARTAGSDNTRSALILVDVASATPTTVLSVEGALMLPQSAWAPDGRSFVFSRNGTPSVKASGFSIYDIERRAADTVSGLAFGSVIGWAPDSTRFFVSRGFYVDDPASGVYTVDAMTHAAARMTSGAVQAAALSADGTSLAYAVATHGDTSGFSGYSIFAVGTSADAVPHELASLSSENYGLAWSPDGRTVAYGWAATSADAAHRGIYTVDVQTGEQRLVTRSAPQFDTNPSFSPDGRWLLVQRLGCVQCDGGGATTVLAPLDGGAEVALDRGTSVGTNAVWAPAGAAPGACACDGRLFAYAADTISAVDAAAPAHGAELARLPASDYESLAWGGSSIFFTRFSFSYQTYLYGARLDAPVLVLLGTGTAVSPDGTAIASPDDRTADAVAAGIDRKGAQRGILVQRARGNTFLPLPMIDGDDADYQVSATRLVWAPDSRRILAVLGEHGAYGLAVVNTATGGLITLAPPDVSAGQGTGYIGAAEWSPDGTRIAYTTRDGLFVVGTSGGAAAHITSEGGVLAWSPDGTQIAAADDGRVETLLVENGQVANTYSYESGSPPTKLPAMPVIVRWSPDGTRIAVGNRALGRELMLIDVKTHAMHAVAAPNIAGIAWSPDSSRIAFGASCDPSTQPYHQGVCIVGREGGAVTQFSQSAHRQYRVLDWCADGTIVFASIRTGV